MAKVRFLPTEKEAATEVEILAEPSVLELALRHKINVEHSCGGSGSCGTCHVFITSTKGPLAARNDIEEAMAKDRGFAEDERLACQIEPADGMIVRVPDYD